MATLSEREKNKLVQEKCQSILTELLKDEDNKYCVDCDAKSKWDKGEDREAYIGLYIFVYLAHGY